MEQLRFKYADAEDSADFAICTLPICGYKIGRGKEISDSLKRLGADHSADLLTKLAQRKEESKRLDTVMDEVMHNLEERVKEGMIDEERSELWKTRARTATFQRRLGMATNAMVASQWPTGDSMTIQDGMQRTLTECAQTAAAIVMKAVTVLKRGADTEEDTRAIDDCYEHMDDIIGELGGELVHWTDWYESAADALREEAEAEIAEERERERVSMAAAAEKERVRMKEARKVVLKKSLKRLLLKKIRKPKTLLLKL